MIYVFYEGTLLAEYPNGTAWFEMDTPFGSYILETHFGWWFTHEQMAISLADVPAEYRAAALLLT